MNYFDKNNGERSGKTPRLLSIHQVVRADLKAWLDGELAPGRTWTVRLHLLFCRECREEVKWLQRLGEDMRDLEKAVPGPGLRARIMAALPDSAPGGAARPISYRPLWPRYAFSGAAALLVLGAAAFAALHVGRHKAETAGNRSLPIPKTDVLVNQDPAQPPHKDKSRQDLQVSVPPVTDKTTQEADRLAAQIEQELARREALKLRQNRQNWSKLTAALRNLDTKNHSNRSESLHLSLSVPDIAEAEARLQTWAQSARNAGVAQQPAPGVQGVAPAATSANSGNTPAVPTLADQHVVTLRVPINQVASLQPLLKQLGAWDKTSQVTEIVTPAGTTWMPDSPLPARKDGAKLPKAVQTDAATDKSGDKSADNSLKSGGTGQVGDQTAARDASPIQVTLVVHLYALNGNLP